MVNKDPLCKVAGNDQYRINNKYDHRYVARPVPEILRDAKSMVGQVMDYGLLTENCEHFVTKLRYGIADSDQVCRSTVLAYVVQMYVLMASAMILVPGNEKQEKASYLNASNRFELRGKQAVEVAT